MVRRAGEYDAVIVGASLAGCTAAILLGRGGARVALVEKSPDPGAFKRICSHMVQASGVPTLERLDLLEAIVAAGGIRSRLRFWTEWGWVEAPPERAAQGVNLRRELLDPIVREAAAATAGVELMLGHEAVRLLRDGDAVRGVAVRDRDGVDADLRATLVVGADGRESHVAELAGVPAKTLPHGRFAYASYFENPSGSLDSSVWFLDPQISAAFPTDGGLVLYVAMQTKDRLPEFRRDPKAALLASVAAIPESSTRPGREVGPLLGKLQMPNRVRGPVAPGLALIGDAALATDPLFGVGCGWAFQSGAWLADCVAPALHGAEPLQKGLARYRRRHRRELRGHAFFIHDYANGRRFNPIEKLAFFAAARDPELATMFDAYATRQIRPTQMFAKTIPRTIAVAAREALPHRGGGVPASR
ncbi:MAG: NAD(P)/FAD-dependent oxidoreductase [Solirubrobacterales bacterium]|nr:NAD(P)/FAD-dependent oxidoreductase [Solirubrobacterales bacterium]